MLFEGGTGKTPWKGHCCPFRFHWGSEQIHCPGHREWERQVSHLTSGEELSHRYRLEESPNPE